MKGETIDLAEFQIGEIYTRKTIAEIGRVQAPEGSRDPYWSMGIVTFDNALLLLVTLEKESEDYTYEDQFDGRLFWWQSQNRQTQTSTEIADLIAGRKPAILFVRTRAKLRGQTLPFVYCGQLAMPLADGERPVTCLFEVMNYRDNAIGALAEVYEWRSDQKPSKELIARKTDIAVRVARSKGQGRQSDPARRKCVELHAMEHAIEHYRALGYSVTDTSASQPYDLECSIKSNLRRVEVKGTQGSGDSVIVTIGEVLAARHKGVPTDLYVLHAIRLTDDGGIWKASGGILRKIEGWHPIDEHLFPTQYEYKVGG